MSYVALTDSHEVTCRKDHECGWCGKLIMKGDKAMSRSYIWEDGPQSDWMHHECNDAMGRTEPQFLRDGWMPGDWLRGQSEWA